MKRLAALLLLAFAYLGPTPALAQFGGCLPGLCANKVVVCINSGHAAAFLARAGTLDGTHTTAYTNLLNSLDGHALSCKLDMLHVYATQNSTVALLNLISTNYAGTAHGSPAFTSDLGFTGGSAGNSTVYIDTGFNPSTAVSPNYTQNSAHLSGYTMTNAAPGFGDGGLIGASSGAGSRSSFLVPRSSAAVFRFTINGGVDTFAQSTRIGHYLGNRENVSSLTGYINGSSVVTGAGASGAVVQNNIYTLSANINGTGNGDPNIVGMASIGSSLNGTDNTNFHNDVCTYMLAVGAVGSCP